MLILACFFVFSIAKVQALTLTPSTPLIIDNPLSDNLSNSMVDQQGNTFVLFSANKNIRKYNSTGDLWTYLVDQQGSLYAKWAPDNVGGFYYVYTKQVTYPEGSLNNTGNLFYIHVNSAGERDLDETRIMESAFNETAEGVLADLSGNAYVIYAEYQVGDGGGYNIPASHRIVKINTEGRVTETTTREANPLDHRWCTNRNEGVRQQVPYDIIPFSWSRCWAWCNTVPNSLCQYNGDGARNCWADGAPSGNADNCTWEEFGSVPPRSGYVGQPANMQNTVGNVLFEDNVLTTFENTGVRVDYRYATHTGIYFKYYSADDKAYYAQKINLNGTPEFAGKGVALTGAMQFVGTENGYYIVNTIDSGMQVLSAKNQAHIMDTTEAPTDTPTETPTPTPGPDFTCGSVANLAQTGSGREALYTWNQTGNALSVMTDGDLENSASSFKALTPRTEDYWGISFDQEYYIGKIIFTTGRDFPDGGYFSGDFRFEVRQNGEWFDVSTNVGDGITPAFPNDETSVPYQSYMLNVGGYTVDAVRVVGTPAVVTEDYQYTTVGELQICDASETTGTPTDTPTEQPSDSPTPEPTPIDHGTTHTVKVQFYNDSQEPQWDGEGVVAYNLEQVGSYINTYATVKGSDSLALAMEVYNETTPSDGNVNTILTQVLSSDGSKQLGDNATQLMDYTHDPQPSYVNQVYSDNNGGYFISYSFKTSGNDGEMRVIWVDDDNNLYNVPNGIPVGATNGANFEYCLGQPNNVYYCSGSIFYPDRQYRIVPLSFSFQIDAPDGITIFDQSNEHNITMGADYGANAPDTNVLIRKGTALVARTAVDMSEDRDWNGTTINTDNSAKKAILADVHIASGVISGQTEMFVPRISADDRVIVCPDATSSFTVISKTCTGGVVFSDGQTRSVGYGSGAVDVTAVKETLGEGLYWRLSGVKNTGAFSYKSATVPTVGSGAVSAITTTGATVGGSVTSNGGSEITERGIVYSSTNATPTLSDSKQVTTGTTGTMSVALTGLTSGTLYHARVYATNAQGTAYASVVDFTTVTATPSPTATPTIPAALNNVYVTFAKFKYNKYTSPASLKSGDTAYIKNFSSSKLKLLQVFLYDYAKKGNQGYAKSQVTTTSMFLKTTSQLPTGKRYAYVFKFQDKATGIIATKYFVFYTTKTWLGKSVLGATTVADSSVLAETSGTVTETPTPSDTSVPDATLYNATELPPTTTAASSTDSTVKTNYWPLFVLVPVLGAGIYLAFRKPA